MRRIFIRKPTGRHQGGEEEGRASSLLHEKGRAGECESLSETVKLHSAADGRHRPHAERAADLSRNGRGEDKNRHPAAMLVITALDGGK